MCLRICHDATTLVALALTRGYDVGRCYYDQEVLITDRKLIAYHYLKCVTVILYSTPVLPQTANLNSSPEPDLKHVLLQQCDSMYCSLTNLF